MSVAWPFLCFGTGLLSWPVQPGRLQPASRFRWRCPVPPRRMWWLAPAVVALPLAGVGAAVAAGLVTFSIGQEWRNRKEKAAALAKAEQTSAALRMMVSELRSGAHPVLAAEAAADAEPALAADLRNLAASARLDGALESAALPRLAQSWELARKHGLPIADVLEAARRDVEAETLFARRLHAKMAGPRMSATVLTILPIGCLALGQVIGAGPLTVLTGTLLGQVFLVAGAVLLWAGAAWSRALTGRGGVART
ncbi:tight adherence protein B [Amycolatopsis sulphurea]|uniref:Tight adherence protein B n=2 Tax=Amycolatopsis sulphurea TaxID=76022 RepID=A0A2A9FE65_9PSEU|nr:tight adherence protein B [Amycolatopsis sulphurea]